MTKPKYNLSEYSDIEIYELILSGKLLRFPNGFWDRPNSLNTVKTFLDYLFKYLGYDDKDILENYSTKFLKKYKLSGMSTIIGGNNPVKLFNELYPNRFKPWEFKNNPHDYWNLETAKEATKWLIEEKLKWSKEEVINKLTLVTFRKYGILQMLKLFDWSIYNCVENVYPNEYKRWNFVMGKWDRDIAIEATKWMFEEKLKWNKEKIEQDTSRLVFAKYGLDGMITKFYNGSPYRACIDAYPNYNFKIRSKYKGAKFDETK